jgi:hypothetical protein
MSKRWPRRPPIPGKGKGAAGHKPAHIFDLCFKRLMHLSPGAVIGFINGLFGVNHPLSGQVEYLSTETVTDRLEHVISDMIIGIDGSTYLIEAQIGDDAEMAVRIFEYVFFEGVKHQAIDKEGVITVKLPKARVIYWESGKGTPDKATLRIELPEGEAFDYAVESFKFLEQSLAEIEERKLVVLLPFYVLKLRKRVRAAKSEEELLQLAEEMKRLLEETVRVADNSVKHGVIAPEDITVELDMLDRLYRDLYSRYEPFKGVNTMVEDIYWTRTDKLLMKAKKDAERATTKAVKKATAEAEKKAVEAEKKVAKATQQLSIKIAQRLLQKGLDPAEIAEATELDPEMVRSLYTR